MNLNMFCVVVELGVLNGEFRFRGSQGGSGDCTGAMSLHLMLEHLFLSPKVAHLLVSCFNLIELTHALLNAYHIHHMLGLMPII